MEIFAAILKRPKYFWQQARDVRFPIQEERKLTGINYTIQNYPHRKYNRVLWYCFSLKHV